MRQMRWAVALLLALFVGFTMLIAQNGDEQNGQIVAQPRRGKGVVVIKAARLIDGTGSPAIMNAVVVITDGIIYNAGEGRYDQFFGN